MRHRVWLWVSGVLVTVLVVAGCVSEETARELDLLREESKTLANKAGDLVLKVNELRLAIKEGSITVDGIKKKTAEIAAEKELLAAETAAWKDQWERAQAKAKEEGDGWFKQLLYMIGVSLGSVGIGRKLGVPLVKSGTKPMDIG